MKAQGLRNAVVETLEDLKGLEVVALEVTPLTDFTDFMVIATGRSDRHVKALVDHLVEMAKERQVPLLGVEGRESHEWVLVDLGEVVVHVMQQDARDFYDMERLWTPLDSTAKCGRDCVGESKPRH